MADLSIQYLGMKLKSPIILGSSGLSGSLAEVRHASESGVGAIVLKSIFEEQILLEIDSFLANTERNKSSSFQKGYDSAVKGRDFEHEMAFAYLKDHAKDLTLSKYLTLISESKKAVDIPIIASINCTSTYNWHYFARRIEEAGADALELNIFLLPSNIVGSAIDNEKTYSDIISAVKQHVTIPISLKIGYYFSNLATSVIELSKTGIGGLVLFNRPFNPDINIDSLEMEPKHLLSEPTEYTQVLRWMSILSGRAHCPLVATTGVHNAEAAIKQILAGATAIEVVSTVYKNGLEIIEIINNGIEQWMDKKGYKTINDFRGLMSQKNATNPADFERVQFMKLYSKIG